jgi:hypothetical protein
MRFQRYFCANQLQLSFLKSEDPGTVFDLIAVVSLWVVRCEHALVTEIDFVLQEQFEELGVWQAVSFGFLQA